MSRWNSVLEEFVEAPDVEAFLAEIAEVCRKHGMALGYDDGTGVLCVEEMSDGHIKWLMQAHDARKEKT